jgi:hypothetical protein
MTARKYPAAWPANASSETKEVAIVPSIIVVADTDGGRAPALQLRERVSARLLRDTYFSTQLIERIAWAATDAEEAERAGGAGSVVEAPSDRRSQSTTAVPS